MRTLMTVEMDTEAGNRGIKEGSLPKLMESLLDQLHPEAAYFTTHDGKRTAYVVFDLQDAAQMVQIAEPLYAGLNAKIDWSPAMNPQDLRDGLGRLQKK
jgi:hypothetical protein